MTNDQRHIKGLGTALITPFDASGKVDYKALAQLLDTQLTGFVDYLVVLGTTGEAATLSTDEKRELRRFIVDYIHQKPITLVLGVGGNNTAAVCAELEAMKEELVCDYAAILSVCPYYNKPNQEGLYQHFCKVAEASPVPVILYNVPGRTGVNLLPETVMRIFNAHPDKIAGIKEASGNLEQIKHLIELTNDKRQTTNFSSFPETMRWPAKSCKPVAQDLSLWLVTPSLKTSGISSMTKTPPCKPNTRR